MAMSVQMDAEAPASRPWRQMMNRVPSEWKEVKLTDFVPKVLRLGFECRLVADSAERHQHRLKLRIKEEFLAWKTEEEADYDWDAHKRLLGIDAKQMRIIYGLDDNSSAVDDDDYVQDVLALDALVVVVILMMFFRSNYGLPHRFYTQIFSPFGLRSSKHHILRDLFLLEQQLPMCLLHKTMATFDVYADEATITDQLRAVITWLMYWIYPFNKPGFPNSQHATGINELTTAISNSLDKLLEYRHLLECLHQITCTGTQEERLTLFASSAAGPDTVVLSTHQVPSVSELRKAGMRIKSRAGDINKSQFEGAILWLPQLSLYDNTTSTLRNLAAFEILVYQDPLYLCPYLVLLGNLAQTKQDVELLIKNDVIVNCIGSKSEVKKMLNGLCRNMPVSLRGTRKWHNMLAEIQQYYKNERHALLNEFKQTYCSKPWVIASTMAAVFLLSMTFLQTFYSMLAYYHTT